MAASVAAQGLKAWATQYQQALYSTGSIMGTIGLSWYLGWNHIYALDAKVERYHVDNRTERIAMEARMTASGARITQAIMMTMIKQQEGGKRDETAYQRG